MLRRFAVLLIACVPISVLAAPVPKEVLTEEQFLKTYGNRLDEMKRAKFTAGVNRLTISVEKQQERVDFDPLESPRVLKSVQGDFLARVAITFPIPTEEPDRVNNTFVGGGFLIVFGEEHTLTFARSHVVKKAQRIPAWINQFNVDSRSPGCSQFRRFTPFAATDKPVYLSLKRNGKKFTAEQSLDGKKWETIQSCEEEAPEKCLLGLFAIHNRNEVLDIIFTDYSIAPLDGVKPVGPKK